MFIASKTCEFLNHGETPGHQNTEAIEMSLANLNKHLENIDTKIVGLYMHAKGTHSDIKPDTFSPDDYIEKLEERIKKSKITGYRKGLRI